MRYYKISPYASEIKAYAWWREAHELGCLFTLHSDTTLLAVCTGHNIRKKHNCERATWPNIAGGFVLAFEDTEE
jgi:hypothetical protein